jgi:hypothetical protein
MLPGQTLVHLAAPAPTLHVEEGPYKMKYGMLLYSHISTRAR